MAKQNKENKKSDFDADGLSDEEEKLFNTDPFSSDTDKDCLSDFEEIYVYGTDPKNSDTDGDSVPDGAEVKMGLNPKGKGKLRDFLIPHEGNNFHPQSLHPKRVIFHVAGAVVVKSLVFLSIMFLPTAAWLTPDVLMEQENEIVRMTNELRQSKQVNELSENNKLRSAAYERAEDMFVKQYFAHISPDGNRFSKWIDESGYYYAVAGENLAMGFVDASGVMEGWKASPTHYDNLIDPDYRDIGVVAVDGIMNDYGTTLVVQLFGTLANQPVLAKKEVVLAVPVAQVQEDILKEDIEAQDIVPETVEPEAPETEISLGQDSQDQAQDQVALAPVEEDSSLQNNLQQDNNLATSVYIDEAKSKVVVDQKESGSVIILSAEVYIQGAREAQVRFANYSIDLQRNPFEANLWSGSSIIYKQDQEQIFNPVVLPSVVARGFDNKQQTKDIAWENIKPENPSVVSQYLFIKKQDSGFVHAILSVSRAYFVVMIGLCLIALCLMVFIEIRKQHPKHILSGLGLMAVFALFLLV